MTVAPHVPHWQLNDGRIIINSYVPSSVDSVLSRRPSSAYFPSIFRYFIALTHADDLLPYGSYD